LSLAIENLLINSSPLSEGSRSALAETMLDSSLNSLEMPEGTTKHPEAENPLAGLPLAALVEAAPESVLLVDKAGRILLANEWAVGSFGFSKRELAGRNAGDLLVRKSRGKYRSVLHESFAHSHQKSEKHIPLIGLRRSGQEFPVEFSLDVVNLGGAELGILVICDVSERSQIEQQLQEAHEKLRERIRERTRALSLANRKLQREVVARRRREEDLLYLRDIVRSSDVAIIGRKLDGTVVSWNPAARRLSGYSAKEIIGKSILTIVAPERIADARKLMAKVRRGERLEHVEGEMMTKGGKRIPIVVTVSPVRNAERKLIGASVIMRDITRRKQFDAQLRYERDRAEKYLEIAEVIILVVDRRARILLMNPKGCEVLGCRHGELLHRDWFSTCVPRRVRSSCRKAFQKVISGKMTGPVYYEGWVVTRPGEERLIGWRHAPLTDESGNIIGTISSGEDITDRRRAEEAIRNLSGRLLQVRDEERRHIARELHDSTAQRLALLITQLGRAQRLGQRGNGNYTHLLSEARGMASQALREVRSLSYLLHPPLLEEMGLASALRVYVAGLQKHNATHIHLDIPSSVERFPRNIELCAFRIVQEALTNVLRHSHSRTARIQLLREPGSLIVKVVDHGRGLPRGNGAVPGANGHYAGIGLAGMRERVNQVDGSFDIRSGKSGTTVTAMIPVPRKAREERQENTCTLRGRSRRSAARHP
jgi:PAS domain S-box-containing protein